MQDIENQTDITGTIGISINPLAPCRPLFVIDFFIGKGYSYGLFAAPGERSSVEINKWLV